MTLEELAAIRGGFYTPPLRVRGTVAKPLFRVAFLNTPEHAVAIEIRGEAELLVGVDPKA